MFGSTPTPQINMLKLNSLSDGVWKWGIWEVIRISVFVKEAPERSLVPLARKHTGKTEPLLDTTCALILYFPEFRTERNKYVLFISHPVYAISVTAARMNRDKPLHPMATCR